MGDTGRFGECCWPGCARTTAIAEVSALRSAPAGAEAKSWCRSHASGTRADGWWVPPTPWANPRRAIGRMAWTAGAANAPDAWAVFWTPEPPRRASIYDRDDRVARAAWREEWVACGEYGLAAGLGGKPPLGRRLRTVPCAGTRCTHAGLKVSSRQFPPSCGRRGRTMRPASCARPVRGDSCLRVTASRGGLGGLRTAWTGAFPRVPRTLRGFPHCNAWRHAPRPAQRGSSAL